MKRHSKPLCHGNNGRVLYYESVYPSPGQIADKLTDKGQFFLIYYGIDCGIDPYAEAMCVFAQAGYVLYGIGCRSTCPETGTGDINGIGTAINCCDADVRCLCGCKEFQGFQCYLPL